MAQAVAEKRRLTAKQRRDQVAEEGERLVRELSMSVPANQLDRIVAALEALNRELAPKKKVRPEAPTGKAALLARIHGTRTYAPEEVAVLEAANLERAFEARSQVLEGALSAGEVATLLGSKTRQTPHDRLKTGSLLAIMDQGKWKFPLWQFDAEGPNGVVPGLPAVLQALGAHAMVSPMQKARFLLSPSPYLEGRTPLEVLKRGGVEAVVGIARGIGVS